MTNTQPSGLPTGIGGKNMTALGSSYRATGAAEADRITGAVGSSSSRVVPATRWDILDENEARIRCNDARADHRATTSDVVEDDELMLDAPPEEFSGLPDPRPINTNTPMINIFRDYTALTPGSRAGFESLMAKVLPSAPQAQAATTSSVVDTSTARAYSDDDVKLFSSFDEAFEIPRVIIDLAKSHIHVPLTLLTPSAFERIHMDPSCIKMRKGMILDDPKRSVLDAAGFPAETTLQPAEFHEATEISCSF
ncbi:hypothetical protein EDD22DRAFT_958267 [Suillus occidentalis]|nr:hypothetical protein EDD22DRAFT_958267 [Suillus occidentalis]